MRMLLDLGFNQQQTRSLCGNYRQRGTQGQP